VTLRLARKVAVNSRRLVSVRARELIMTQGSEGPAFHLSGMAIE
jgi:hypothetical protein